MSKATSADPFAPDPTLCPECGRNTVITEHEACVQPYGTCPDVVKLIFVWPVQRCLRCAFVFTDHTGEKAQEEALALYRRVLCPTPNIRKWIENVKDRALAHVPPSIIDEVVKSWELYRRSMEAGGGIEPPRSGI